MEMVYRGLTLATRNQASAKLECVAHARFAFPTQVCNQILLWQQTLLQDLKRGIWKIAATRRGKWRNLLVCALLGFLWKRVFGTSPKL